ncbi:MAG: alpha-2-macroglobulin family protein [Lysobacterales bacterium]
MNFRSLGWAGWIMFIALGLVFSHSSQGQSMSQPADTASSHPGIPADLQNLDGFPGSVGDGQPPEQAWQRPPLAEAQPLPEATARALLDRMQPLEADADDRKDFALRAGSQPPPRTGVTVQDPFPPAGQRERPQAAAPQGPFEVLRYGPEGEVGIAGQISISFDRPMVAVTSQDDSVAAGVPLQMQPQVPGQWRWVGTRTLLFEPEAARLPMATEYRIRVDPAARAADGSAPAATTAWQFSTPAPLLQSHFPDGPGVRLQPLIGLKFDQRIDPAAMLPFLRLTLADGRPGPRLRLAREAEIKADGAVPAQWLDQDPQRSLILIPESKLPTETQVSVVLAAGAPSAEGPRLTPAEQRFEFSTFGAFKVVEHRCGWRGECTPNDEFHLRLSNALAEDQDIEALVRVKPAFDGATIRGNGNTITIGGYKPGLRSYQVDLSSELRDVHGQSLSGERQFQFKVGASPAVLLAPGDGLITVDPQGPPRFVFHSINLRQVHLRVFKVQPADWPAYLQSADREWKDDKQLPRRLPGQLLVERTLDIDAAVETMAATTLELQPWLKSAYGHLVVELIPTKPLGEARLSDYSPGTAIWLQVTQIGLDAVLDGRELHAWVTRLGDGQPLSGVSLRLLPTANQADTDSAGLATLELPQRQNQGQPDSARLEARLGEDLAFLPENPNYRGWGDWQQRPGNDELRWHVFDDRGLYKPGEEVHLKGWLRVVENRPNGGLALPKAGGPLRYSVFDSRGNTLTEGDAKLGALGGFALNFKLPDTPNLGSARIRLQLQGKDGMAGGEFQHLFQIQEFRTPEFAVDAQFTEGTVFAGERLQARTSAQYYAGGALPGAPVAWTVSAAIANYNPPNQSDYSFGIQSLWWRQSPDTGPSASVRFDGQTDASGHHDLAIVLDRYQLPRPLTITAESSVQDVNRQTWMAHASTLVHPAAAYVGMKTKGYFVERGQPLTVDMIVVDLEGKPLRDRPVSIETGRVDWLYKAGEYQEVLRDPQRCELRSDDQGLAQCSLNTAQGGQYRITAITTDAAGRHNVSQILRWVSGGQRPPVDNVEVEELQFIPDRDQYGPGDTARILVQAPFADGYGLLTLGRHGVLEQRQFKLQGSSHTLEIPIKSEWLPNVEVSVMVVGNSPRDDQNRSKAQPRPAQAVGSLTLKLSTAERRLAVDVQPAQSALAPGARTQVALTVLDAARKPVANAEIALIVVDEAILALGGYELADPMDLFYQLRDAGLRAYHLRPTVRLASDAAEPPEEQAMEAMMVADAEPMMRSMAAPSAMPPPPPSPPPSPAPPGAGGDSSPIAIRSDFNPLAVFLPALQTDANGRVSAEFKLPDNLTRYRIMAVAVSGSSHYGIGESQLTARLPLMLRPSPPRFLNFGDRFEFPVVLQNQTDAPLSVQLALDARNLKSDGALGYAVSVPANDRVEVRFPMAADEAGTARYQIAAATGDFADAARGQLPVWTPATTEAFATYGVIDQGATEQAIAMPAAVWPQFGGLIVTTTSTALQSLTDAYLYLHQYPFECSEQLASRVIATTALRDLLQAFEVADLATPEAIKESVLSDLKLLESRQNPDGSFAFWRAGQEAWPYISLHATHALIRARDKGYLGSPQALQRALAHIRQIEQYIPSYYGDQARRHIIAYGLYVRALDGDRDAARARKLIAEAGNLEALNFESLGWLLGVMSGDPSSTSEVAQIRRFLGNRTTETAANASFASSYSDGEHLILHSDRRADAVILEAMIGDQPDSDLIPKLVSGLQAHRVQGRWANTQDNVFVLLALDRYFQTFESVTPDFVARTWLGDDFAGEHAFRGRSTERHQIEVPMQWLSEHSPPGPLLIAKDGPGRLYYRIGMDYAPRSLQLAAAQHGFEVERRYVAIDDPADVQRLDDGSWQIRAGARIAVELTMVATASRYHVALVDPLPAGLEVINPDLTPSAIPPGNPRPLERGGRAASWWWGPWYQHQNLRDNRVEAFTALLYGGVYSYRYEARATTPGEFVVPPAKAEEMYQPETFGRSASDRVIVK